MTITYADSAAAEVRAELARQRLTQAALAKRLGWDQKKLSRRLTGEIAFSLRDLQAISESLQIPIASLVRLPEASE